MKKREKKKLSEHQDASRTLKNVGLGMFFVALFESLLVFLLLYVSEGNDEVLLTIAVALISLTLFFGWMIFSRRSYAATILLFGLVGIGTLYVGFSTLASGAPNIIGLIFCAYFLNLAYKAMKAAGFLHANPEVEIHPEIFE